MSIAGRDASTVRNAQPWTTEFVELVEEARCAAMIANDVTALRALLADDATWVHSSGTLDGRDAFIAKIESGESRYLMIDRSETAVRLYDDAAVASGIATMSVLANGEPRSLRNRYTNIWMTREKRPLLISAQSTKLI